MRPLWSHVIAPLLDAADARTIVEIGVDRGETTELLLGRAERLDGAAVHAIDPSPADDFDAHALQRSHPRTLRLHRARSHEALPGIGPVDAVLVDGDHNWFTVTGELRLLAATAAECSAPLPLIIAHDVGWPYGRRDMYYDPCSRVAVQSQGLMPSGLRSDWPWMGPACAASWRWASGIEPGS
jgi:hypothetical protein